MRAFPSLSPDQSSGEFSPNHPPTVTHSHTPHCTDSHTHPAVVGPSVRCVARTFAEENGEKRGESGESIVKCVKRRRETVPQIPYCFLISELYMLLKMFLCKAGMAHTISMQGL